ncbi:hypothetical protein [Magnetospira sp. QH-2]|uniref:hypothetical protein n=1 Tax=Magnetospira sp. (strain QH-2) TaxID=1288970 RepID=UPI0003E8148B|nr:hypothetical protein [Magnetospira sp. QH-2]CCQ74689.1 putative cytochrome C oxidase subunit II [Magnetospira sp. QH-2]
MTRRLDKSVATLMVVMTLALFGLSQPGLWSLPDSPPIPAMDAVAAFIDLRTAQEAAHKTGETDDGIAIVRPPAGDVYLQAERFRFLPKLELEQGQTYTLHVMSADVPHGLTLPDLGIAELLIPGVPVTVTVTPGDGNRLAIRCSEYCGLDHSRMESWIRILPPRGK